MHSVQNNVYSHTVPQFNIYIAGNGSYILANSEIIVFNPLWVLWTTRSSISKIWKRFKHWEVNVAHAGGVAYHQRIHMEVRPAKTMIFQEEYGLEPVFKLSTDSTPDLCNLQTEIYTVSAPIWQAVVSTSTD